MTITRRELSASAAALGLLSVLPATLASAQAPSATPSAAELMAPGPIEDLPLGKDDAPVTIIEYASMTCPHCAHFEETTWPQLKKDYVDTGKVRYIFREFPLDPLAAAGAMLARCGGKDKFIPIIEVLFKQQRDWVVQKPIPPLLAIAKQLGFTEESFNHCLSDQKLLDQIEAERELAASKFGVNSTPTFFINGKIYRGAVDIDEMSKAIDAALKS